MESDNAPELRAKMGQNDMGARSPTYLCGILDDLDWMSVQSVLCSKSNNRSKVLRAAFRRR